MRILIPALAISAIGLCQAPVARQSLDQGVSAFNAGDYASAAAHFERAVAADAGSPVARLHLGNALRKQSGRENWRRGVAVLEEAVSKTPRNRAAMASLGALHFQLGQFSEARRWFGEVVKGAASSDDWATLGFLYYSESLGTQFKETYPVGPRPNDPGPVVDAVENGWQRKRFLPLLDEAQKMFEKAVEVDRQNGVAMSYRALVSRQKARLAARADEWRALIADAESWTSRADAALRTKPAAFRAAKVRADADPDVDSIVAPVPPIPR